MGYDARRHGGSGAFCLGGTQAEIADVAATFVSLSHF
jgi:hypothetical protein